MSHLSVGDVDGSKATSNNDSEKLSFPNKLKQRISKPIQIQEHNSNQQNITVTPKNIGTTSSASLLKKIRKFYLKECKIDGWFEDEQPLSIRDCYVDVIIVRDWEEKQRRKKISKNSNQNSLSVVDPKRNFNPHLSIGCLSIEEIFAESGKILVIGEAGTGKTTWCNMLCNLWASNLGNNNGGVFTGSVDENIDECGYNKKSQKYLHDNFDFCFLFHLRNIRESKWEREVCILCSIPFCDEITMSNFILEHSERILFILGINTYIKYILLVFPFCFINILCMFLTLIFFSG